MAAAPSDLSQVTSTLKALEDRVCQLEETQNVKDFMTEFGLRADLIDFSKSAEDAEILADNYMTEDGTFQMSLVGTWGPDKKHLVRSFVNMAKDPDVSSPDEPRPTAQGIDWAMHLYLQPTVDFAQDESGTETAHFKARQVTPLMWNGTAKWVFADNDSVLKKVDVVVNGKRHKEWRMHKYGVKGLRLVDNTADAWANITRESGAEFFESRARSHFQRRLNPEQRT